MSTSFNQQAGMKPTTQQIPTVVAKATGPMGSKIKPETYNGTAGPATVGGYEDGTMRRSATMGATATDGAGADARQITAIPTMSSTPTPYPGQSGRAPSSPLAPAGMAMASMAHGSSQGSSGESASASMATKARNGGKVGGPGVGQPTRHAAPVLPTPNPTFPEATPTYKPAVPMPTSASRMSGVIQGARAVNPGGSNISPLRG